MSDAPNRAIEPAPADAELLRELERTGLDVNVCYQCGRCSSGCPVSPFFDLLPLEVVRLCVHGQEELLLASRTIWLCASCATCTTRCPNGIDIAGVIDLLRQRLLGRDGKPAEPRVAAFHRSFLGSVRRWGRTYEVGMIGAYKMRSGDLFGDLKLGLGMFWRGKLRLLPRGIHHKGEVRSLFAAGGQQGASPRPGGGAAPPRAAGGSGTAPAGEETGR